MCRILSRKKEDVPDQRMGVGGCSVDDTDPAGHYLIKRTFEI
jgi:hypothetical protein